MALRASGAAAIRRVRAWARAPAGSAGATAGQHAVVPPRPRTPRFRPPVGVGTLGLYPVHVGLAGLVAGLLAGPRAPALVLALAAAGVLAVGVLLHPASPPAFVVPLPPRPDAEPRGVRTLPGPAAIPVRATRVAAALAAATVAVVAGAALSLARLDALDRTALEPRPDVRLVGIVTEPLRVRAHGVRVVPVRITAIAVPAAPGGPVAGAAQSPDGAAGPPAAGGGARRPAGGAGQTLRPTTGGLGETVLVRAPARVPAPPVRVGDELVVRGALRWLRAREGFERRRGVHAVLEARDAAATGRRRASPIDALRRRIEDTLDRGLPPELAALARGMVLGQDAALPADLRDAFRASGLAHLVAASGQNVMLLSALVLAALAAAGVPRPARLVAALAAIAAYVPLAGAAASIQRAGVMGAAGIVAALASRPASRWHALLLAAAATLALDPRACEDPGWQLSFAAVIAILALHGPLRDALVRRPRDPSPAGMAALPVAAEGDGAVDRRRLRDAHGADDRPGAPAMRGLLPGPLAEAAALTIAATAGTAPLLSLHFGTVSLVSLPANLLAVPAVAPVMWLGTVAGLAGGPVGPILDAVAALPLAYLCWLGRTAAALPGATVGVRLPGPAAAAVAYVLLGAACVAVRQRWARETVRAVLAAAGLVDRHGAPRWRVLAPAVVAAAAAVALAAAWSAPRAPDGPTLTLLDVGQGEATLLQDGGRAMLIDTGPPGAPLLRELRAAGVRRLDAVLISHDAADHAGGLPELVRAMPIGLILDGRGAGGGSGDAGGGSGGAGARAADLPPGIPRRVPAAGQRLRIGGIVVDVLWPPPGDPRRGDPNDTAAVALARCGPTAALLTADAESPVTLRLDLPRVDILKVAHHGSADPGLPALLARLRPRIALIPVGPNTYGHPAPSTLRALRAAVPDVRRTDRDGTIRVPLGRSCGPVRE
jgi:competence protein ComEC